MLRLSNYLFTWNAEARLADYIERALLNHIYPSQHPRDGRVIYNLNIDMGGHKSFEDPFGFTCCVGSGMESHSKYGTFIYFHNDEELFVNQYIASELTWEDKNIVLTQETAFPEEEGTRFTFECRDPVLFTLQIRYPQWAERGMQVWVNGEQQKIRQQPGSFVPIKRVWSNADEVRVSFPFSLRLENMPDDKNRVAVFNGPVLLAGDLGPENDPKLVDPFSVPVFRTSDRDPANWIEPLDRLHHFVTKAGQPRNVNLLPFYSVIDRSYSIFWDMMTDGRWEEKKKMHQRQKEATTALKSKTFDFVNPGEIESEYLKKLQGVGTESFLYKQRLCREATRGGWFSYDLNIPLNEKVSLVVKYWGGFEGSRTFSILVDGHTVAIENIAGMRDGHFVNVSYALPLETTNDKEVIRIKFVPHDFHYAGPVFGIRTIRTTDLDDMELNLAIL